MILFAAVVYGVRTVALPFFHQWPAGEDRLIRTRGLTQTHVNTTVNTTHFLKMLPGELPGARNCCGDLLVLLSGWIALKGGGAHLW